MPKGIRRNYDESFKTEKCGQIWFFVNFGEKYLIMQF